MQIEMSDGPWPSDRKTSLLVGGIRYPVGDVSAAELREEALAFAKGLAERRSFCPEFCYEPLFNVEFMDDSFVTYTYRPRFRRSWLWWLGGIKITSQPESISEAIAYLTSYADDLGKS